MANNRSRFTVELLDKLSRPASRISSALDRLASSASKRVGKAFDQLGGKLKVFTSRTSKGRDELGRFTAGSKGVTSSLGSMGVGGVAMGSLIAEGATKALGALVNLGKGAIGTVVEFTTFAQNSGMAFDALAKHGASGAKLFDHARGLAVRFGLDVQDTTDNFKKLLAAQFNPSLATDIVAMGADLRFLGGSADDVSGAIRAITQIKGTGILQGDELNQLANAGVSIDLIRQKMQKLLGVTSNAEVLKLQEAGKIDADTAISAILQAVMAKTGESALGQRGQEFADKTLDGMAGRLKARGQNLLVTLGQTLVPRVEAALGPLAARLDKFLGSAEGEAAIGKVADGIGTALEFAGKAIEKILPLAQRFMSGFIDKLGPALPGLAKNAEGFLAALDKPELADAMGRFGERLGLVASMVARIGGFVLEVIPALIRLGDVASRPFDLIRLGASKIIDAAATWGPMIIDGLVRGIEAGVGKVTEVASRVAGAVLGQFQKIFNFGSPSKVMQEKGEFASLGFVKGMASIDVGGAVAKLAKLPSNDNGVAFGSAPSGRDAMGPQVGGADLPKWFDVAAGGGGSGLPDITYAPVYQITQQPGQSAKELADEIDSRARRSFEDLVEELALAAGA